MNQSPTPKSPPTWIIRFLEWFCPEELIEGVLGDLLEEYESNLPEISTRKANLRFFWSVLRFFHPSILLRNHRTVNFINMGIFKNYLKVAFRSFWRQKLTTSINIFGLTLGLTCAGLSYIFTQHELSFDKFHKEPDKIYYLMTKYMGDIRIISTPGPLAPNLQAEIPEITDGIRLQGKKILVEFKQELFNEEALLTDANFFSFFDFKLSIGNAKEVLANNNSLVISKAMALKYFGSRDPIGQLLILHIDDVKTEFMVSGVAENSPKNSSIKYSFLVPIQNGFKEPEKLMTDWESYAVKTFVRLNRVSDTTALETKLSALAKNKYEQEETDKEIASKSFLIFPFKDFHFNGFQDQGIAASGKMLNIKRLGWIGFFVLLVACFNFMNLSNAKSSKRLKEVGVRKVLGARNLQLKNQFIFESILVSLFALLLAMLIMNRSLPYIENLTEYALPIDWINGAIILPLLAIALLTGLISGWYPSFLLSRLKVVDTFKSKFKIGGNNWMTKSSLVFQFAVAVGLLSCTFIMYQQQQFISNLNLGYNEEEIVVVPLQVTYDDKEKGQQLLRQYKQEITQIGGVESTSGLSWSFTKGNAVSMIKDEDGKTDWVPFYKIEPTFIPMLEIEVIAGRNFRPMIEGVEKNKIIVNEAFVKKYEIEKAVGYKLPKKFQQFADATIIGVVKDFNFENLRKSVKPVMLTTKGEYVGNVLVKIKPDNIKGTIAKMEAGWKAINPNYPFKFSFLDEDVQLQYLAETRWNRVFTGATFLTILIACLGLFGLIALALIERTKEIGIRKILGASIFDITWMVAKQFIWIIAIASIIAIPVVIYGMQDWLQNFAYRIDIQWFVLLVSVLMTAFLALLVTGIQAIKATLQNPVEALNID